MLHECAQLLDLDPDRVARTGALFHGTTLITSLLQVEIGYLQSFSLVLG